MSNRTRITITIIAVLAVIAALVPMGLSGFRDLNRPPVLITVPPGATSASRSAPNPTAPVPTAISSSSAAPSNTIYVHIAGAVLHPDVYKLPADARIFDALKSAGGSLPGADVDSINLAEPLHDGEKVYVPAKGQSLGTTVSARADNQIGYVGAPEPALQSKAGKKSSKSAGSSKKLNSPSQGQIDINTADEGQLQELPGVGPAMAARIITTRQSIGHFRRVDDLLEVIGVGPKKYKKMLPFIKV